MCKKFITSTASKIGIATALIHLCALLYMLNTTSTDAHGFIYLTFASFDFPVAMILLMLGGFSYKDVIDPLTVLLIFGTIWWYFVPVLTVKIYITSKNIFNKVKYNIKQGNINLKKWGVLLLILVLIVLSFL